MSKTISSAALPERRELPNVRLHAVGARRSGSFLDILTAMPDLVAAMAANGKIWRDASQRPEHGAEDRPPSTTSFARQHPRTLIFMPETKDELQSSHNMSRLLRTMNQWYRNAGEENVVTLYTSIMSDSHREIVPTKLDEGVFLCFICSERGAEINLPNIGRVIQFGGHGEPVKLWEKFGLAGRGGMTADAYLIIPPKMQPDAVHARYHEEKRQQERGRVVRPFPRRNRALAVAAPPGSADANTDAAETTVDTSGTLQAICSNSLSGAYCMRADLLWSAYPQRVAHPAAPVPPPSVTQPLPFCCSVCEHEHLIPIPFDRIEESTPHIELLEATLKSELEAWGLERWQNSWKAEAGPGPDNNPESFVGKSVAGRISRAAQEFQEQYVETLRCLRKHCDIKYWSIVKEELADEVEGIVAEWREECQRLDEEADEESELDSASGSESVE